MIRFEERAYSAAIHPGRTGERWQASAARARIPAPPAAACLLRSAWCKPGWCDVWPAAMSLTPGAVAVWQLAARGGGTRSGEA
jgi:hypothetical protein